MRPTTPLIIVRRPFAIWSGRNWPCICARWKRSRKLGRLERLELDLGRHREDLLLRLAPRQLGEQALVLALEHLRRGEEQQ